jgi:hypothetical protein
MTYTDNLFPDEIMPGIYIVETLLQYEICRHYSGSFYFDVKTMSLYFIETITLPN